MHLRETKKINSLVGDPLLARSWPVGGVAQLLGLSLICA